MKVSVRGSGAVQDTRPIKVIFDTDMWADIDDMLALSMLYALESRREIKLEAITISTQDPWPAAFVDLMNTFYQRPQIPIGIVHGGVTADAIIKKYEQGRATPIFQRIAYVQAISEHRDAGGSYVYPHQSVGETKTTDALSLLRKVLASQADNSVVIIEVGFCTNLAHLLASPPDAISPSSGLTLVKEKVRSLCIMAGSFSESSYQGTTYAKGQPEFNLALDVSSAQSIFERWPTEIVVTGLEVGMSMLFPAKSIADDFSYVPNHPVAEAYRYYSIGDLKWPHDHPTSDLATVLYAARPDRGYFSLSKPGKITILPEGASRFDEMAGGLHRYLMLDDYQRTRALEGMVMLASQPPAHDLALLPWRF